MRIMRMGGYNLAISSASDLLETKNKPEVIDLSKLNRVGKQLISKAAETKKVVSQPYSMSNLLNLLDTDEYHSGCVDALSMATVMQFDCKNSQVKSWMEAAEFPACEDQTTILAEMIKFYLACGNGFLIKMRNAQGQWMGLERMLPSEVQIVENYDEFGFFKPNYIQVKNNQKKDFAYEDIIHVKKSTHRSNAWGLACLPIAINIEILGEIKTFDYNNFKNGLMIDYFVIVEGGTLRDGTVTDEQGNEVLTDAYTEIKDAARLAIQMLSDMPRAEKINQDSIDKLMGIINTQLGDDFTALVNEPTKAIIDRCVRLGLRDTQVQAPTKTSIGLWGIEDQHLSSTIQKQQLFWIGNHFEADVRQNFADTLSKAIEQGYTKEMLADTLKDQFNDIANRSSNYWQGLAEHTALRIREFGRLQGYKKAKARYYKLVVILDDRTSDICRALAAQDRVYPLNDAIEVMDNLMALDTKSSSLDDARDYIKALAPWIKDDQIEFDSEMNPVGVSGAHTPFPPFHWKCRTSTELFI